MTVQVVMRPDPSMDIAEAIEKIREQMRVNLTYFSEPDRTTLDLLQSHIETQLKEIEYHQAETERQLSPGRHL